MNDLYYIRRIIVEMEDNSAEITILSSTNDSFVKVIKMCANDFIVFDSIKRHFEDASSQ